MLLYERYLARHIYQAFAFVLFAFSALFFFFDLLNELGAVGRGNYWLVYALVRVALLIPSRLYEITPIAALISAIYVFATLAANSEYTILRVSSLSIGQALRTLMKIGLPIVAMTFFIGEMIGPYADQLSERIRLDALGSAVSSKFRSGVWVKDTVELTPQDISQKPAPARTQQQAAIAQQKPHQSPSQSIMRFVNVGELKSDGSIEKVRIYEFDPNFRLINLHIAQSGEFVPPDHWRLSNVASTHLANVKIPIAEKSTSARTSQITLDPTYQSTQIQRPQYLLRSQLTPQILSVLLVAPERMSIKDLFSYIHHLEENHQDTQRYNIALWRKFAYPFAIFVMLTLSLPFAYLHTRAGVVGIKVFGGIMLGMSFQLTNTLFSHIGMLKTWPAPLVAAIPALLYLALGITTLRWVDRH